MKLFDFMLDLPRFSPQEGIDCSDKFGLGTSPKECPAEQLGALQEAY